MGCDIHAEIERRAHEQYWHYASVNLDRNYLMFGLMAGVRRPDKELWRPRGIPSDACYVTKSKHQEWEEDSRSASWLTVGELNEVLEKYKEDGSYGDKLPPTYAAALAMMRELGDESRIVFWFDN